MTAGPARRSRQLGVWTVLVAILATVFALLGGPAIADPARVRPHNTTSPATRCQPNTYTYVNGNPINLSDPDGHDPHNYACDGTSNPSACSAYSYSGAPGPGGRNQAAYAEARAKMPAPLPTAQPAMVNQCTTTTAGFGMYSVCYPVPGPTPESDAQDRLTLADVTNGLVDIVDAPYHLFKGYIDTIIASAQGLGTVGCPTVACRLQTNNSLDKLQSANSQMGHAAITLGSLVVGGEAGGGLFDALAVRLGAREAALDTDLAVSGIGSKSLADPYSGVQQASQFLRGQGVPRSIRQEVLGSFEPSTIDVRVAGASTYGMRFYTASGDGSSALGRYLTPTLPATRSELALPTDNAMSGLAQWQVRQGSVYLSGRVGPNFGYPGGGVQWFVPNLGDLS